MRGQPIRTPEKVAEAFRLREQGWTYKQIGEYFGVSLQAANEWVTDPYGVKRDLRKQAYRGTCVDCGASTFSGDKIPPKRCHPCAVQDAVMWTREAILGAIRAWAREHGGIPPSATDWNPNQAIKNGRPEKAVKYYRDNAWPCLTTVQTMFGSWNAAITAAGYTPRRPGTYGRDGEDDEVCREVAERYAAGESTLILAEEYECSPTAIRRRILRAGGRLRSYREAQILRLSFERSAA